MHTAGHLLLPPDLPEQRVACCLGLISDTHMPQRCATLPPAALDVLRGVDLILHAGDVGELSVLNQLSALAPVVAVHGNDETVEAQRELPYQHLVTVAGQRIVLCHSHHPDREQELASRRDDAWAPKLARWAARGQRAGATIVVFGHIHIPMAHRHEGVLLVNPGAIASANEVSRQRLQTVALLFVRDDGVPFVVHVDLARPTERYVPRIDWAAGFRAALDSVSASILSDDLATDWDRVKRHVRLLAPDAFRDALLRVAHRCWAGRQEEITRADLLAELQHEMAISPALKMRMATALAHREPGGHAAHTIVRDRAPSI